MLWKRLGQYPRLFDVLIVVLLIPASLASAGRHPSYWNVVPLVLAQVLPLLWRRRFPVAVLGFVLAVTLLSELTIHRSNPGPTFVAVYTVVAHLGRGISLRAGAVAVLVLLVPSFQRDNRFGDSIRDPVVAAGARPRPHPDDLRPRASCASSACATACRRSCWRTTRASSRRARPSRSRRPRAAVPAKPGAPPG